MKSKLTEEVIRLLKSRAYGITCRQISEETQIPHGWIRRLQQGKIAEPSCPRVEKLYEYLSGNELAI